MGARLCENSVEPQCAATFNASSRRIGNNASIKRSASVLIFRNLTRHSGFRTASVEKGQKPLDIALAFFEKPLRFRGLLAQAEEDEGGVAAE